MKDFAATQRFNFTTNSNCRMSGKTQQSKATKQTTAGHDDVHKAPADKASDLAKSMKDAIGKPDGKERPNAAKDTALGKPEGKDQANTTKDAAVSKPEGKEYTNATKGKDVESLESTKGKGKNAKDGEHDKLNEKTSKPEGKEHAGLIKEKGTIDFQAEPLDSAKGKGKDAKDGESDKHDEKMSNVTKSTKGVGGKSVEMDDAGNDEALESAKSKGKHAKDGEHDKHDEKTFKPEVKEHGVLTKEVGTLELNIDPLESTKGKGKNALGGEHDAHAKKASDATNSAKNAGGMPVGKEHAGSTKKNEPVELNDEPLESEKSKVQYAMDGKHEKHEEIDHADTTKGKNIASLESAKGMGKHAKDVEYAAHDEKASKSVKNAVGKIEGNETKEDEDCTEPAKTKGNHAEDGEHDKHNEKTSKLDVKEHSGAMKGKNANAAMGKGADTTMEMGADVVEPAKGNGNKGKGN